MDVLINPIQQLFPAKKAAALCAQLNDADDDWEYRVFDCHNGLARIDIFDEDGIYVGRF